MKPTSYIPYISLLLLLVFSTFSCKRPGARALYRDKNRPVEERVEDLLRRMTLNEKIGQMTQVSRNNIKIYKKTSMGRRFVWQKDLIREYGFGSLLSGGGSAPAENTPDGWADMIDEFQGYALKSRLGIPLIYGVDAVHGHGNLLNATIFPHNIGLGATRNVKLVEKIGRITALEAAATGVHWNFAPCIAVPMDERWGRTYEGFSEDPVLVESLGAACIRGQQSVTPRVLSTAKHFFADGATTGGKDQGNAILDQKGIKNHLIPYTGAIEAGVETVMASFSSLNGVPMHANKEMLTGVLKEQMKFKGFVISDWAALNLLPGTPAEQTEQAINAGIDMVMVPDDFVTFIKSVKYNVRKGNISKERIDDAVSRILRVKFEMGLFDDSREYRHLQEKIGSKEHREVARQAVRESLVLLKNKNRTLPLTTKYKKIWVTGLGANDLGSQCGGWTLTWQGMRGNFLEGHTILDALKESAPEGVEIVFSDNPVKDAEIIIFVTTESPYAEGGGDNALLTVFPSDRWQFDDIKQFSIPIVTLIISGRPLILDTVEKESQAIIACWLPGTEGLGITDVLWGDYAPTGKLPYVWPRSTAQLPLHIGDEGALYPYGYGLTY